MKVYILFELHGYGQRVHSVYATGEAAQKAAEGLQTFYKIEEYEVKGTVEIDD